MSESTCVEHEVANCRWCAESDRRVRIAIARRSFQDGFARGADPDRARATHAHFWAGHDAGVRATAEALDEYVRNEGLR